MHWQQRVFDGPFFDLKNEDIKKMQKSITQTQNSAKNQLVVLRVVHLCDYYCNKITKVTVLHDHC